jgi:hemoglobin
MMTWARRQDSSGGAPGMVRQTLYERLGGRPILERVNRRFYDKVYAHPWLGQFFEGVDQGHVERQQTDLMSQAMGVAGAFHGTYPVPGHKHMFITKELYAVRMELKAQALAEAGIPEDLAAEWLAIDRSFEKALVKDSPDECAARRPGEQVLVIPKP